MRPLAPPRRPRGNPPGNQATVARATKLSSARWRRAGRPGTVAADRSGVLGVGEEGRTRDPGGSLHTSVAAVPVRGACALPSPRPQPPKARLGVCSPATCLQTPGSRKTCSAERQQTRVVTRPPRDSKRTRTQLTRFGRTSANNTSPHTALYRYFSNTRVYIFSFIE